ncbi:MAG TPA: SGNH/GDSL hydrolase family protein [Hyphomonadaceae bacterium]|nr:SGNH/GDSL hydrolase family protein [Hyphomonadaceae bacterium]
MNGLAKRVAVLAGCGLMLTGCASIGANHEAHPDVSQLVFIGDSNLDIGRAITEREGNPQDGKVVPPGTVGKRYSNADILPEFLGKRLGLAQANYAWGGATSGMTNIAGGRGATDMRETGLLAQMTELEAALGGRPADAHALYMVMAGSNDLAAVDKSDQAAIDAAIKGVLANLRTVVTRLDTLGAEFIVVGTRTPRPILSDHDRATEEPNTEAKNDAAGRQLNIAIRQLVEELDAELGADVEVYDFYADIRDVIAHAESYGLAPYSSDPANYCTAKGQTDCSRLINYDNAHKTSAVHAILADKFIRQFGLSAK